MIKHADILTPNNISIQYELATVVNRAFAKIIDYIFLLVYFLFMHFLIRSIFKVEFSIFEAMNGDIHNTSYNTAVLIETILVFPVLFFYTFFCETYMRGQTIAKKMLGMRVIKLNGENLKSQDGFIRWIFAGIDFWFSSGILAIIFSSSSEKSQRLGGFMSRTIVVKTMPTSIMSIKDILSIKTKAEYQPKYLAVTKFTDEDMLLIKTTLSRYKRFPNSAHKEFLIQLAKKTAAEIGLEKPPKNMSEFLKNVLQDYIVLTR